MSFIRLLTLVLLLAAPACHTPQKGAEKAGQPAEGVEVADIDAEADRILMLMCESLKGAQSMSFEVDVVYEEVLDSGLKVEHGLSVDIKALRPNRLQVRFSGDNDHRVLTCDGETVTLVETEQGLYGTTPARASLDATIDMLAEDYGITLPCADYLFSDPHAVLTENVRASSYLGTTKIGGVEAHHLVFSQEGLDWQIWIETGARSLPLRTVLTYIDAPGAPRFEADLSNWNLVPGLTEADFKADVPADMERIEFQSGAESTE